MQGFIATALLLSLITSILIILLSLTFNLLKSKVSPKVQYWTWVILFIALLVPFRPTFGRGLIKLPQTTEVAQQVAQEATEVAATASKPDLWSQVLNFPWLTVLALIWLGGALFHLGKHGLAYYKFRQLVTRWGQEIQDLRILEHFFEMKERLGIKEEMTLIHYPAGHSPMMTGFKQLKVLLPETDYTDEELELIFEHELTHYLHRDIYVNLLGILVTSLHWFNPIVRFAYKEIQEAGEIYCDYDVLQQRDANYRAFYGETIITMIDQSQKQPVALTTCFYSNKFSLKRRITAIMYNKLPKRLLSTGLLVLIPLSLLLSGSIFAFTSQQADKTAKTKQEKAAITSEGAVKTALAKANLNADQVKNVTTSQSKDYYQVSFQTETEQYVCRISRQNGQVLSLDKVALKKTNQVTPASSSTPTPEPSSAASTNATPAASEPAVTPAPEHTTPAPVAPVVTPAPTPAPVAPAPAAPVRSANDIDDDDDDYDDDDD